MLIFNNPEGEFAGGLMLNMLNLLSQSWFCFCFFFFFCFFFLIQLNWTINFSFGFSVCSSFASLPSDNRLKVRIITHLLQIVLLWFFRR